jgi:hypothetical protein
MSDTKVVFLPSMSLIYEDNVLESVDISGETFYRKQRDWQAVARAHELTMERMGDENARLRELVKYAYECAIYSDHATCDDCERINGCCILADRMRELGVEAKV